MNFTSVSSTVGLSSNVFLILVEDGQTLRYLSVRVSVYACVCVRARACEEGIVVLFL